MSDCRDTNSKPPLLNNWKRHCPDTFREPSSWGVRKVLHPGEPHTLPIEELRFTLHKGGFQCSPCLRYEWQPTNMSRKGTCGASFSVEHALCCSMGGFPIIRHNEFMDFTANTMSEVCHDVCIEPPLQALSDESLPHTTSNSDDRACLKTFGCRASGVTDTGVHFSM